MKTHTLASWFVLSLVLQGCATNSKSKEGAYDEFWEACLRTKAQDVRIDLSSAKDAAKRLHVDLGILIPDTAVTARELSSWLTALPPDTTALRLALSAVRASYPIVRDKRTELPTASCKDGHPVVLMPLKNKEWWNSTVAAFVVEHEFAHHRLGHVHCAPDKYGMSDANELAADCEAADQLSKAGLEGIKVIFYMCGVFDGLKVNAHPSTRERHDNLLRKECGE